MARKLIQTTRIYSEIEGAVRSGKTLISLQGSSRSSKTYNTLIWLITYLCYNPCTQLSIVRKTMPALKGSVLKDFREIARNMGVWNEKNFNKSENVYMFANGSEVDFFSCADEERLRGRKSNVLFVNEASELNEIEWQQLKMRTTRFAIIDYNPSFSDEHWICGVNKDPRTYHFISTYKDNPFLEQAVIDEIESLKHKNKTLWQVYGLGQQSIVEGLVFEKFEQIDAMPMVEKKYIGMDFGYTNDPTAMVEVAVMGDNMYLNEICYQTHMLTSDIVSTLKEPARGLRVISESADPRLVDEIYKAGINIHPVRKFAGSIEAGITAMLDYKIHITKGSTNLIKEFKNYTYSQDKEGKWLNKPIDAFNHGIDAVRYVTLECFSKYRKKFQTIDDSVLY